MFIDKTQNENKRRIVSLLIVISIILAVSSYKYRQIDIIKKTKSGFYDVFYTLN
jgi:hypothetical protein